MKKQGKINLNTFKELGLKPSNSTANTARGNSESKLSMKDSEKSG
jgi:hypothetical protein